jgi:hypothetical protein
MVPGERGTVPLTIKPVRCRQTLPPKPRPKRARWGGGAPPLGDALGQPSRPQPGPPRTSLSICCASSRVGASTSARGPSPDRMGGWFKQCWIMGMAKLAVLPLPVSAQPRMSHPDSATGMPWHWMGVGVSYLCAEMSSRMGCARFCGAGSEGVLSGGGGGGGGVVVVRQGHGRRPQLAPPGCGAMQCTARIAGGHAARSLARPAAPPPRRTQRGNRRCGSRAWGSPCP